MTINCEKESIKLVSVRTINTDYGKNSIGIQMRKCVYHHRQCPIHHYLCFTSLMSPDTDSPQVSSVRSIVDNEDQELNRDLLNIKGGL